MAEQLAYVIITPYSLHKSRTGGILSRLLSRTGLDREGTTILDVTLPKITVPLNPGKNITVISEVVALNHLLRWNGVDPAQRLNERLIRRMAEQREVREYLSEDYE